MPSRRLRRGDDHLWAYRVDRDRAERMAAHLSAFGMCSRQTGDPSAGSREVDDHSVLAPPVGGWPHHPKKSATIRASTIPGAEPENRLVTTAGGPPARTALQLPRYRASSISRRRLYLGPGTRVVVDVGARVLQPPRSSTSSHRVGRLAAMKRLPPPGLPWGARTPQWG